MGYLRGNQPKSYDLGAETGFEDRFEGQYAAPAATKGGASSAAGTAGLGAALAGANPYVIAGLAAFQVVSGLHEAETIRRNAAITARINEMNARAMEYDAWQVERQGEAEIAAYQPQIDQAIGEQRVAYAAEGVDVNFGTAAEIQAETRLTGFLNTMEMQKQARARALGIRRQARNLRLQGSSQASASSMAAQGAQTGGLLGAGTTLASGYARK